MFKRKEVLSRVNTNTVVMIIIIKRCLQRSRLRLGWRDMINEILMYYDVTNWLIMVWGNWELTWLKEVNHIIIKIIRQLSENEKNTRKEVSSCQLHGYCSVYILSIWWKMLTVCMNCLKLKNCFFYPFAGTETKVGMSTLKNHFNTWLKSIPWASLVA